MKKLTNWIKNHQIAAFYLIAFAITYGLGFSYDAVLNRDQGFWLPIVFLALCGPAFAGIIVSVVANPQPKQGSRRSFWIAFGVAWPVSLAVYLANFKFIEQASLSPILLGVFAISVLPVAFVIAAAFSRNLAVRRYLSSMVRLRGVWGWALLGLLLVPFLIVVSIPLSRLFGVQAYPDFQFPEISLTLIGLAVVKFFYQLFFFNTTAEEIGWRGFVMPRLQARTSPLLAALLIGVIWAPWHFLFWQADGDPVLTVEFWAMMLIAHSLLSVLIVWICNRARGNILVAGITHAATNTVQMFVPAVNLFLVVLLVAALLVVLLDRMWKKLPSGHPAVYQSRTAVRHSQNVFVTPAVEQDKLVTMEVSDV